VYRDSTTHEATWAAPARDGGSPPRHRPDLPRERTRRLPSGEAELGALLEALRPRMLAVALRFTRDADAAHDVVQGALEKALRHRGQFRGQARVATWLHRIVVNQALMWLRSERRRATRTARLADAPSEALTDPTPDAAAALAGHEAVRRLRRSIARLGPEERDVIERCVLPGRSYAEYGADRGVHPGAAKSRAFRARRHLEALLREAPKETAEV